MIDNNRISFFNLRELIVLKNFLKGYLKLAQELEFQFSIAKRTGHSI